MKTLITLFFVLGISLSHAQSFDHIVYKQEVNRAYELAVKQGNYKESLKKLETVKKNYRMLYGEDYRLQAYCYKMLGNDSLAAISLKTCWSVPSFDMRTLWYVAELDPAKLMKGFNEYQNNLVQEGFDNFAKNRPSDADSLLLVFKKMSEEDRLIWNEWETDRENKELRVRIDKMNEEHEAFLENYVRTNGYPGEKKLQFSDSEIWILLIHSAGSKSFYQRMKPVFLDQVRKGNMSPFFYANWVDQYQFYNHLPTIYNTQVGIKRDFTKNELKEIRRNRFEIGLADLEFSHPVFD